MQCGDAADEPQVLTDSLEPVGLRLAGGGAGVRVVGGAEHANEDLCLPNLASAGVDDRYGGAGVVGEEFLARAVNLSHRAAQPLPEFDIALAEARAAVGNALRLRPIFLPQQLQRDALTPQLTMDLGEWGTANCG